MRECFVIQQFIRAFAAEKFKSSTFHDKKDLVVISF